MKLWHVFVILAVIAALVGGGVYAVNYLVASKQRSEQSQWTPSDSQATTTAADASTTPALSYPLPSATSTVPSTWKTYMSDELGYQISYPADMVVSAKGAVISMAFPKSIYFHWPLEDDAKLTVTVASTCSAWSETGSYNLATTTFELNGYSFTRNESHDAAAGNLYNEWSYDTVVNGLCYRIDLFDHGANGAGLYVGDQSLIKRYDDRHTADLEAVMAVWNTATYSFRARSTGSGLPEGGYMPGN